jgi:succinate dehydrogenase/fumarate reductase flavoprotein subunit
MNAMQRIQTDVLVIGAGGAGLRAALAAAENGSGVLVVNKGPIARSGITLTAAGGMQAPFHPDDSVQQYYQDTIKCGYNLSDRNLAWVLAAEACDRALDLERYGCRFVRDASGGFSLGKFPGQSQPRNLFIKGGGIGLVSALAQACRAQSGIRMIDDFFVTGLLTGAYGGETVISGAMGLDLRSGDLTLIEARAVVLATGGCQCLWEVTDCPTDATGDGVIHAYRAGAELVDMEMILFYPSVLVWPPSLQGAFVHYEFLAESILDGNIYDKDGLAVLPKPLPVRDEAMRLMEEAIRGGRGGPHGGLLWYVGDSPKGADAVRKKLDLAQYNYLKSHGVDPASAKIEVAPGAHYLLGGIHMDSQCGTSVKGLFATPECAGNFDGANRLAGSGIAATQVFGARAGLYAHKWASDCAFSGVDAASAERERSRVLRRLGKTGDPSVNISHWRHTLRTAAQTHAGVSRNATGLKKLAETACEVRDALSATQVAETRIFNQQLMDLLELETLCDVAELVAGSALLRAESRGHHFREDFPHKDDAAWLRHTRSVRAASGPQFDTKEITESTSC